MFYLVYDVIKSIASGARNVAVSGYRTSAYILSKAKSFVSSTAVPATNILNSASTVISTGAKVAADAVKLTADTAKFVADNTVTVFVAIITIIGIIYSMCRSRK